MKTPDKSRKRGRVTSKEMDIIKGLADQNWTNKAIANHLKRDEDTISKYRRRAKEETESHGVLREALKDAQRDHWRTLTSTVFGLRGRFSAPGPHYAEDIRKRRRADKTDRRERLLINALREHHAPDHRLWQLIESWTEASEALRRCCEHAWEFADQAQPTGDNGKEAIKPIFQEKIVGTWFRRAIGLEEPEPVVEDLTGPEDDDHVALVIGGVYVAAGTRGAVEGAREQASRLLEEMGKAEWSRQVSDAYQRLMALDGSIDEAVEELGLMEGFPGDCPYCPARTLDRPARRLRSKTSVPGD